MGTAVAVVLVAVFFAARLHFARRSGTSAAPPVAGVVPGLPLLGSAISLGRWGAGFLAVCRDVFGPDAFLLNVGLGQSILFLFNPALLETFLTAKEDVISFKPAVRRFTQRCVLWCFCGVGAAVVVGLWIHTHPPSHTRHPQGERPPR